MIASFRTRGTEDLFDQTDSKAARKALPRELWSVGRRKLAYLNAAKVLTDLRVPPGNQLEALKGDRAGQHSIRINDQYRVYFRWEEGDALDVEVVDYH